MSGLASTMLSGVVSSQFVRDFGDYSYDFPLVNPDGSGTWQTPLFGIIGFIFAILGFGTSAYNSKKPEDEKKIMMSNIYFYLGLLAVSIGIIFLFVSGDYLIQYNQQWYEWYDSLPSDGKSSYQQMKMTQELVSAVTSLRKD